MTNVEVNSHNLKRHVILTIGRSDVSKDVDARLRQIAKTMRMPGFRPGKVPLNIVEKQYRLQIESEILSDKLNKQFAKVVREANFQVAGQPNITFKTNTDAEISFDANFEVFPEITIGNISELKIDRLVTSVGDEEVNQTLEILQRQRATFNESVNESVDAKSDASESSANNQSSSSAELNDKVKVDFVGTIDGEAFDGGTAEDLTFILGENYLLPEFTQAILGMKVNESKEFDLIFPTNYQAREVAGKQAQFKVVLKNLYKASLPEIDGEFAKSLGIESGDVTKMRQEILDNLQREAQRRTRVALKNNVMDALLSIADFAVPEVLIEQDKQILKKMFQKNSQSNQTNQSAQAAIPDDEVLSATASRRVKLGLMLGELVKKYDLKAKADQIQTEIQEFAKSYEDPDEVVRWYYSDSEKLSEIEAYVAEGNVVELVCSQAKIEDKPILFKELAKLG